MRSIPARSRSALAACAVLLAAAAPTARADLSEIDWIVGANLGYSEFRFRPKIDSSLAFPTYALSVGGSWRSFYATAAFGGSLQDADLSEEDNTGDADRRDLDLTLGWQIGRGFGVFAGWKDGRTALRLEPRDIDDDEARVRNKERYGQEGPYLGGSYSWFSERYGSLGVSVAYAWLDADNLFVADGDGADEGELPEFDDLSGSVNGDARGFSYGLSWTKPLGAELLYRAQLKINDYEQDLEFEGQRFDSLDQRFVSFTMGLAYVF